MYGIFSWENRDEEMKGGSAYIDPDPGNFLIEQHV
jgi:hypothetical protein